MSATGSLTPCPRCTSPDVVPARFGYPNGWSYANVKKCVDCEYVWVIWPAPEPVALTPMQDDFTDERDTEDLPPSFDSESLPHIVDDKPFSQLSREAKVVCWVLCGFLRECCGRTLLKGESCEHDGEEDYGG